MKDSKDNYKRIGLLEFSEKQTGTSFGRTELLLILLSLISLLSFTFAIRIPGLGKEASYAAGILLSMALLYICKALNNGIVVILGFVLVYVFGLMDSATLFSQISNSAVTMLLPMLILSYAVSSTDMAKRLTLIMIRKWGEFSGGTGVLFLRCGNSSVNVHTRLAGNHNADADRKICACRTW